MPGGKARWQACGAVRDDSQERGIRHRGTESAEEDTEERGDESVMEKEQEECWFGIEFPRLAFGANDSVRESRL